MEEIKGRREEERVEEGERRRARERLRGKENSQLGGSETSQGGSERVERALLTTKGDKLAERAIRSTSAGEEKGSEELGQTVVPSPETPTPPEGGDFAGAERSTEKKHSESQREGSSPPDNLETHAQGNGVLFTEMEGEVVTSKEKKIEKDETEENETMWEGESETCNSFGVKPTAQTGQREAEPTLITIAAVDQKNVKEGVLRVLAETDWEIEPVEERG